MNKRVDGKYAQLKLLLMGNIANYTDARVVMTVSLDASWTELTSYASSIPN